MAHSLGARIVAFRQTPAQESLFGSERGQTQRAAKSRRGLLQVPQCSLQMRHDRMIKVVAIEEVPGRDRGNRSQRRFRPVHV